MEIIYWQGNDIVNKDKEKCANKFVHSLVNIMMFFCNDNIKNEEDVFKQGCSTQ